MTQMVPGATMSEVDLAGRRVMLGRLQQMGLVSKGASMDALIDARVGARLGAGDLCSSWGQFLGAVLLTSGMCCLYCLGVVADLVHLYHQVADLTHRGNGWPLQDVCAMGHNVTG